MTSSVGTQINMQEMLQYLKTLPQEPVRIITLILDLAIVIFLVVKLVQLIKGTRALQLLKGIIFLILITIASGIFELNLLNYILSSFMTYGVLLLIVIFQPELRRALEQLGSNKVNKFFGIDKDIETKES